MQLRAQGILTVRPGPSSDSLVPLCDRGHRASGGLQDAHQSVPQRPTTTLSTDVTTVLSFVSTNASCLRLEHNDRGAYSGSPRCLHTHAHTHTNTWTYSAPTHTHTHTDTLVSGSFCSPRCLHTHTHTHTHPFSANQNPPHRHTPSVQTRTPQILSMNQPLL